MEDFNLLNELEFKNSSIYTYLDNDEFDADPLEVTENEGSDTDAGSSNFDNNNDEAEPTEKVDERFACYERGLQYDCEDSDGEPEIIFLRLKVKLLMKESNEQYNEVCAADKNCLFHFHFN